MPFITKIFLLTFLLTGLGACAGTQSTPTGHPPAAAYTSEGSWVAHRSFKIRKSPKAAAQVVKDVRNGTRFDAQIRAWDEIWHEVWMSDDLSGFIFGRPFERSQQSPSSDKYR